MRNKAHYAFKSDVVPGYLTQKDAHDTTDKGEAGTNISTSTPFLSEILSELYAPKCALCRSEWRQFWMTEKSSLDYLNFLQ